jgi:hypothetical protein
VYCITDNGDMQNTKLYQIQYSLDGVTWRDHTTTSTTGNNAFGRLIWRIRNGEVDPREQHNGHDYWRLLPVTIDYTEGTNQQ